MAGQPASRTGDEAASWVARMDAGTWTEADEAELQAWLGGDVHRRGALLRAQAAWMTLDKPEAAEESDDDTGPAPRISRRAVVAGSGAALAASLIGGFVWLGSGTRYTTEVGEIRRVPLADGSIAAINTASRVDVHIAANRRAVRIDRGEAFFQVAKDPARPFVVEAGRVRVQAVGTAFSVRRRDNGADILVTEGIVDAWADGAEGARIRLAAGQRAFVADNAAIAREAVGPSSVDRALAWRAGKIDLVGQPLSDAVAEFNRYNQRQIVLTDPTLAGEQFDGVFRTDDPEGFATAVHSALAVPVDLSNSQQIRIGRARR